MHRFDIFNLVDTHITRERIEKTNHPHLYPSESSVVDIEGNVHGACLRNVFYRLTHTIKTNPPSARSMYIFAYGNMLEAYLIEQLKQMGLWYDDHIKWYNPEFKVSGEVDVVLRHPEEPDMLIGAEIKSFYGYDATKEIMGNRKAAGFPKLDHLLQTMNYADWFKETFQGFKMIYLARDNPTNRKQFDIQLHRQIGHPDGQEQTLIYPVVDGQFYPKITLNGIYDRYREIWDYYDQRELPPRDYKLFYTKEEMEQRINLGLVAKTNKEGFQKKPDDMKFRKADWRCLTADTLIVTPEGLTPIKQVRAGDQIISGDGQPHRVNAVIRRKPDKPVVQVKPYQLPAIRLTEDHPVKVYPYHYNAWDKTSQQFINKSTVVDETPQWIEAGKLKEGRYRMAFPFPTEEMAVDLDPGLVRLLGYFTAEGSYQHSGGVAGHFNLEFSLHSKEHGIADDLEEVARQFTNRYGKPALAKRYFKQDPRNTNTYMRVVLYSKDAVAFMKRYVLGSNAREKHFAPEVMTWPRQLQKHLLSALMTGDGCEAQVNNNWCQIYSTASRLLAHQVFILMLRLGYLPGITEQTMKGGFSNGGTCYHVRAYDNIEGSARRTCEVRGNEYLVSIYKVVPVEYTGLVYDLTVDGLPEILTEGGVVHNCRFCDYKWHCWDSGNFTNEQLQIFTEPEGTTEGLDFAA